MEKNLAFLVVNFLLRWLSLAFLYLKLISFFKVSNFKIVQNIYINIVSLCDGPCSKYFISIDSFKSQNILCEKVLLLSLLYRLVNFRVEKVKDLSKFPQQIGGVAGI